MRANKGRNMSFYIMREVSLQTLPKVNIRDSSHDKKSSYYVILLWLLSTPGDTVNTYLYLKWRSLRRLLLSSFLFFCYFIDKISIKSVSDET